MTKRLFSFLTAMVCTLIFMRICPIEFKTSAISYFSGSGTVEDPYQITSKGDLKKLAEIINTKDANDFYKTAHYIQTTDIDLGNESWIPIGVHWDTSQKWEGHAIFSGIYDGKGHSITGLNVSGAYPYAGLFGRIGSSWNTDTRVENLIVKGTVKPSKNETWAATEGASWTGGICGEMGYATIRNCSFIGEVSGLNATCVIGGIAGKVYFKGNIINTLFIGNLNNTAYNSCAGILANAQESNSEVKIINCYATGTMNTNGSEYAGALTGNTGSDNGSKIELTNCYYSSDLYPTAIRSGFSVTKNDTYKLTPSELRSKGAGLLGFAFAEDTENINDGYPIHINQSHILKGMGTKANPYQISSKKDLFYLSDAVNSGIGYDQYYIQTQNIDLENEEFTPIGTYTKYSSEWMVTMGFNGHYDGNKKIINGLNVNRNDYSYNGLFGWSYSSDIIVENLVVFGSVSSSDRNHVGGIVGELGYTAKVKNCAFIGDIVCKKWGGGIAGGFWQGGMVENCYFNGTVSAKYISTEELDEIGGIVGRIDRTTDSTDKAIIKNCYAAGKIISGISPKGNGGVIGKIWDNVTFDYLDISNNYCLDSMCENTASGGSLSGCNSITDKVLISCADKLGSPFVNNTNENFNNGYPVFEWQTNSVSVKPNVNSGFKGKGTAENPYQISSTKDLNRLAELINDESTNPLFRYAYYVQTNDIDLKNVDFTPIGIYYGSDGHTTSNAIFAGSYDGNYHSITNLNMAYSNGYCGLFGRVGEYNHDNSNCIIKNLSVTGSIECYSDSGRTGGIIGELAYGATIKNCDFHGGVTGNGKVGAIVGNNYCGGTISNCYSNAKITTSSTDSSTGGMAGEVSVGNNSVDGSGNANIENSYFNGSFATENTSATGAICGSINENGDKKINLNNNFFLSSVCNGGVANKTIAGCTKLSSVALKACADMLGTPYIQNDDTRLNNGYPVFEWQIKPYQFKGAGTYENPYQISSKEELEMMRDLVNSDYYNKVYGHAHYIQTTNIDLENDSWIPIGIGYDKNSNVLSTRTFYGTYNGNKHYINNLSVNESAISVGLFGVVDGESASITRLVVNGDITSSSSVYCGGIVGKIVNNAKISGCAFVGDVSISATDDNVSAGGIAGVAYNGAIVLNCYHNGKIASSGNAGGILGTAEFTSSNIVTLGNCYQTNGAISGKKYASIILGYCKNSDSAKGIANVRNCYCTNDSGLTKTSQNATTDNTYNCLKADLRDKVYEELGSEYSKNTSSALNNGYPVFYWQAGETKFLMGDVNDDGEFSIADAVMLQKWLLNAGELYNWQNGDFCKDNRIDVFDLCMMKHMLVENNSK